MAGRDRGRYMSFGEPDRIRLHGMLVYVFGGHHAQFVIVRTNHGILIEGPNWDAWYLQEYRTVKLNQEILDGGPLLRLSFQISGPDWLV